MMKKKSNEWEDMGYGGLEIEYYYKSKHSIDVKNERKPLIIAYTTLPKVNGTAPAYHRHHLLEEHKYKGVRVKFPYANNHPWPQDATLHFLLMTEVKSSENQWGYQKTASARILLAKLLAEQDDFNSDSKTVKRRKNHSNVGRITMNSSRISSTAAAARSKADAVPEWKHYQTLPFIIDSYYMPAPGEDDPVLVESERHKGDLIVRLAPHTKSASSKFINSLEWQKSSEYDITPANIPHIQAAMMMSITRNMSAFSSDIINKQLKLDFVEQKNVHAPYYVQESGVQLPGSSYWSQIPDIAKHHVDHHGGQKEAGEYLTVLLKQSLARHNMTQARFLIVAKRFEVARNPENKMKKSEEVSDTEIHRAIAVLTTAAGFVAPMMRYEADIAILSDGKRRVVESFNQANLCTSEAVDSGGVSSVDLLPNGSILSTDSKTGKKILFNKNKFRKSGNKYKEQKQNQKKKTSLYISDQYYEVDDRNEASGGAPDCEDGGHLGAVHFVLITDPGAGISDETASEYPVLRAARQIGSHYRAVGVLSSVLSRNLSDSQNASSSSQGSDNDQTIIGSPRDRNVKVGAHMFTILVPQRVLQTWIRRGVSKHHTAGAQIDLGTISYDHWKHSQSKGGMKNDYHVVPPASPLFGHRELPVALCEGTGILHPLPLAREFYATSVQSKLATAAHAVMDQEAQVRFHMGCTSDEVVEAMNLEQSKGVSFTGVRRTMKDIQSHLPSALEKFMPMHEQDQVLDNKNVRPYPLFYRQACETFVVPVSSQMDERRRLNRTPTPRKLVGDFAVPILMGQRNQYGEVVKNGKCYWGLPLSDILHQRSHVALMPTPEPPPAETRIIDKVYTHIAPAVSLHLDRHLDRDPYLTASMDWIRQTNSWKRKNNYPSVSQKLRQLKQKQPDLFERYSLIHAYAHPRDFDFSSSSRSNEMTQLVKWLHTKNDYVVAADVRFERATYRLGLLRLDVLVECGDTWNRATEKLEPIIKSRALSRNGIYISRSRIRNQTPHSLSRIPSFSRAKAILPSFHNSCSSLSAKRGILDNRNLKKSGCKLPERGRFKKILEVQASMIISYIVASWENRNGQSEFPMRSGDLMHKLVDQIHDFGITLDARISTKTLGRYKAVWFKITGQSWTIMPSPGELWTLELMYNFLRLMKAIIDNSWYPDDIVQTRRKQRAMKLIIPKGKLSERIKIFLAVVVDPRALKKNIGGFWDKCVKFIIDCVETLEKEGNPMGTEFKAAKERYYETVSLMGTRLDFGIPGIIN